MHNIFGVTSDVVDSAGNMFVTAYALFRPDNKWALLIVNKDQGNSHRIGIRFEDLESRRNRLFSGAVKIVTFGNAPYRRHPDGPNGSSDPDDSLFICSLPGDDEFAPSLTASLRIQHGFVR